ncbi:unnamed protein product [Chilo suppressalis]|uniref:Uncharacterized protein n=1 Tax=Chilo suppressalis TaxID=168631 RepID=A0ABN8B675_CHISP|nr:unnamed protein product [Chilo suppressalis]
MSFPVLTSPRSRQKCRRGRVSIGRRRWTLDIREMIEALVCIPCSNSPTRVKRWGHLQSGPRSVRI